MAAILPEQQNGSSMKVGMVSMGGWVVEVRWVDG